VSVICVKYRILPTRAQETLISETLETLRGVYNSLVNERKFVYETTGKGIGQYAQEKHFTDWRKRHPELAGVHSHLMQNVALRVNLAFTAFFRRVKSGDSPGFPRFKGRGSYDSLTFKEYGNGCRLQGEFLQISKIGQVKTIVHRPLLGEVKTCTIRRQAGKWFACFACADALAHREVEHQSLPESGESIGIDVGLNQFAALSDGTFVANPRFFRRDEKALAKAGRRQAKTAKRSRARRKANKVLSRIHERIRNRRHDFVHQFARRLVNQYGLIAVEGLNVKGMVQNHCLAKSISDAAWSMFRAVLTNKAESASRRIVAVDPAYTSQDCHQCGYRAKKKLSERWHLCPMCGASLDRDTNAAINILAKAKRMVWDNTPSVSLGTEEAMPL
jgi:putative transposase